jgi:hypothetical protein
MLLPNNKAQRSKWFIWCRAASGAEAIGVEAEAHARRRSESLKTVTRALEHPWNKTLSLRAILSNFQQRELTVRRKTIRKRMRSKLQEVKQQLRSRMALLAA